MAPLTSQTRTGLYVRLEQREPIPLDVELHCARGEVLALVGPSGSGKSTVLRCIAGLNHPAGGLVTSHGVVWLDTRHNVNLSPQRRRVGMVFQDFALLPHLSVSGNVSIALGHIPAQRRPARVRELLRQVHLEGMQEARLPATLSGGQQQRVALARALARDPEVMLLDEPFSAVDQVTRRKLRLELAQLTRSLNIPIVLVTHDLDEACMLSHRLCVLHVGTTLQSGSPETVMKHPSDATVARVIDVRNLFEAEVTAQLPARDTTQLGWAGYRLDAAYAAALDVGDKVCWCISPEDVLLHRRVWPSRGERENPVRGRIVELVTVGGLSNVIVELEGRTGVKLNMDLPPHVVKRNALEVGEVIGMSLLQRAIHIMPWQSLRAPERARGA